MSGDRQRWVTSAWDGHQSVDWFGLIHWFIDPFQSSWFGLDWIQDCGLVGSWVGLDSVAPIVVSAM